VVGIEFLDTAECLCDMNGPSMECDVVSLETG